jgi:5-methylcytosine-specific restriction endonuclease McrA
VTIGYPKPERRAKTTRRRTRQRRQTRAEVRRIVFLRERGHCQRCGRRVRVDVEAWRPDRAHVNERVPRSRGGSPFDPENCELLCRDCHLPGGRHAPTAERQQAVTTRRRSTT